MFRDVRDTGQGSDAKAALIVESDALKIAETPQVDDVGRIEQPLAHEQEQGGATGKQTGAIA
jgi:hypothetical protein